MWLLSVSSYKRKPLIILQYVYSYLSTICLSTIYIDQETCFPTSHNSTDIYLKITYCADNYTLIHADQTKQGKVATHKAHLQSIHETEIHKFVMYYGILISCIQKVVCRKAARPKVTQMKSGISVTEIIILSNIEEQQSPRPLCLSLIIKKNKIK